MKKLNLVCLAFCMALASCARQNAQPSVLATQTPPFATRVQAIASFTSTPPVWAATPPISVTQTVIDFSSQTTIVWEEKKAALYTYNQQVIDHGLSLHIEEVNPQCHKDLGAGVRTPGKSVHTPMKISFTFTNLNSFPLKISKRFDRAGFSPSNNVGADLTTVLFFESGERIYTEGDLMFFDYVPGPDSFVDILPGGAFNSVLEIDLPNEIGKGGEIHYDIPPGYYFAKFIYWPVPVESSSGSAGTLMFGISSNTIAICVE